MDVQFSNGNWTEVTVDSVAEESVCPRGWGTQYGIKPVDERNRMNFVNASGDRIPHHGQRDVRVKAKSTF